MAVTARPRHKWNSNFMVSFRLGHAVTRRFKPNPKLRRSLSTGEQRLSFTGDEHESIEQYETFVAHGDGE